MRKCNPSSGSQANKVRKFDLVAAKKVIRRLNRAAMILTVREKSYTIPLPRCLFTSTHTTLTLI